MTLLDAFALTARDIDTDTERLCCVFAQAVLERWGNLPPAVGDALAAWRLWEVDHPWSPCEAAVASGVAEVARYPIAGTDIVPPPTGRWVLCQGWRRGPDVDANGLLDVGASGHTFLLRMSSAGTVVQLDSVAGRGPAIRVRPWADVQGEFRAGVAYAVLRHPRTGNPA